MQTVITIFSTSRSQSFAALRDFILLHVRLGSIFDRLARSRQPRNVRFALIASALASQGNDVACHRRKSGPQSRFKRQSDILLRQRSLRVLGGVKIVELVQPHLFLERSLAGKAVQQHRQPPGHARGPPYAAQCHFGIAIEVVCFAGTVGVGQRAGQIKNVGNREVEPLAPVGGTMWAASPARNSLP
jgi:hypothetical protein